MAGFGRMDEKRSRSGGGEGGCHLARDVPRLADADDDDAPGAGEQQIKGAGKACVYALDQLGDCLGFGAQHFPGQIERVLVTT